MSALAASPAIAPVGVGPVVIEPMTRADIECVQQIDQASSLGCWSAETYRRELASGATYLVARSLTRFPSATSPFPAIPPTKVGISRPSLSSFFKRVFKYIPERIPERIPATPRSFISGYGGVSVIVDEAHILALAVLPSCRRQGIGEQILRRLIDTARRGGATLLTLEVRASNNAAQHLYRKYGFLPVGHRPGYYADTGEDAIIMTVEPVPHLP